MLERLWMAEEEEGLYLSLHASERFLQIYKDKTANIARGRRVEIGWATKVAKAFPKSEIDLICAEYEIISAKHDLTEKETAQFLNSLPKLLGKGINTSELIEVGKDLAHRYSNFKFNENALKSAQGDRLMETSLKRYSLEQIFFGDANVKRKISNISDIERLLTVYSDIEEALFYKGELDSAIDKWLDINGYYSATGEKAKELAQFLTKLRNDSILSDFSSIYYMIQSRFTTSTEEFESRVANAEKGHAIIDTLQGYAAFDENTLDGFIKSKLKELLADPNKDKKVWLKELINEVYEKFSDNEDLVIEAALKDITLDTDLFSPIDISFEIENYYDLRNMTAKRTEMNPFKDKDAEEIFKMIFGEDATYELSDLKDKISSNKLESLIEYMADTLGLGLQLEDMVNSVESVQAFSNFIKKLQTDEEVFNDVYMAFDKNRDLYKLTNKDITKQEIIDLAYDFDLGVYVIITDTIEKRLIDDEELVTSKASYLKSVDPVFVSKLFKDEFHIYQEQFCHLIYSYYDYISDGKVNNEELNSFCEIIDIVATNLPNVYNEIIETIRINLFDEYITIFKDLTNGNKKSLYKKIQDGILTFAVGYKYVQLENFYNGLTPYFREHVFTEDFDYTEDEIKELINKNKKGKYKVKSRRKPKGDIDKKKVKCCVVMGAASLSFIGLILLGENPVEAIKSCTTSLSKIINNFSFSVLGEAVLENLDVAGYFASIGAALWGARGLDKMKNQKKSKTDSGEEEAIEVEVTPVADFDEDDEDCLDFTDYYKEQGKRK